MFEIFPAGGNRPVESESRRTLWDGGVSGVWVSWDWEMDGGNLLG